ncbi:MAG TPA: ATPase, partial [Thermoplasmata archaeon]|nr:ATPase [Thermoplasmata archaeon]
MVTAGRTLTDRIDLVGRWAAVLEEAELRPRILELADRFPEERSLEVPFPAIESADLGLADLLLDRPEEAIAAGIRAMKELIPAASAQADDLRIRVVGLPTTARRLIRMIRESDLNQFIALDGIVRKATEVRPQIREAVFSCLACRAEIREPQDDGATVFREPLECPTSQGGCGKPAGRTRFRLMPEKSTYIDSQRIEVQENPETLKGGAHPQGLSVLLTEDLTGQVIPGNRVVVNGILKSQQRATASRSGIVRSTTFDLMLLGNSIEYKQREYDEIEISEAEEKTILAFRGDPTVVDKVVLSLAPTIKGMEEEKEAIALQLFGGVEKKHADGIRVRGDIHILIIGDPGTAKSQLLR